MQETLHSLEAQSWPRPSFLGPETLRWMRDWALFGGITSAVAPSVATALHMPGVPDAFPWVAAAVGTLSGIAVGWLLSAFLLRLPERSRVAMVTLFGPPILGGWGAMVSSFSAWLVVPGLVPLAVACGSIAAMLQTAWFAPLYALQVRRQGVRWPLLAIAVPMALPTGMAAVIAGIVLVDVR